MSMSLTRRDVLTLMSGSLVAAAWPQALGDEAADERRFEPLPGDWRTFEVETEVTLRKPQSTARNV